MENPVLMFRTGPGPQAGAAACAQQYMKNKNSSAAYSTWLAF